jgi:hypothetical protein
LPADFGSLVAEAVGFPLEEELTADMLALAGSSLLDETQAKLTSGLFDVAPFLLYPKTVAIRRVRLFAK